MTSEHPSRTNAIVFLFAAATLILLAGAAAYLFRQSESSRLEHRVYVWQRTWTPSVIEAVTSLPDSVSGILPLAAEIGFTPEDHRPVIDWMAPAGRSLPDFGGEIEFVVRVGESAAATRWNPFACDEVARLCREIRQRARDGNWSLSGIQIDYDCPSSRLDDYGRLLRHLREDPGLESLVLSFTALPSWLDTNEEAFRNLTLSADYFVLQVHSLVLPKTIEDPVVVIDLDEADRAARQAGSLGIPFHVALPTYASFVVIDEATGSVTDVVSEDLGSGSFAPGQRWKLGESPARDIANLVRSWRRSPPGPEMKGIVWYRLPVSTDVLNWPRETWELVMAGTPPRSRIDISVERQQEGFARVVAVNSGMQPETSLPESIAISAPTGKRILAGDGGKWYWIAAPRTAAPPSWPARTVVFEPVPSKSDRIPLPVGRRIPVGWFRLEGGTGYDDVEIESSLPTNEGIE